MQTQTSSVLRDDRSPIISSMSLSIDSNWSISMLLVFGLVEVGGGSLRAFGGVGWGGGGRRP